MDLDVLSPNFSDENLRCSNCKNYLSYLPIYLTNSGRNICGRCPITTKKCTRNLAFEVLCQFVNFPCRFKEEGCEEKMLAKDIPGHEEKCRYKIVTCPNLIIVCDWKGSFPTLIQHCLDKHFETFLPENCDFTVDLTISHQSKNFFQHDQVLYILSRKFDTTTNILQYAIYHIKGEVNMTNHSCTITLQNGRRILTDECRTTAYNEKEYISVVLDSLTNEGTSCFSGKVTIGKCIKDEISMRESINEQLLSQLKCTKCLVYVLPPIYHHEDNNIYCPDCKTGYQFRNYNLDNIANMLNYPCGYKDNGCDVILKPEAMKKHIEMCQYGEHECLFWEYEDCLWEGIGKDMLSHIQKNHEEKIIENGSNISDCFNDDLTDCYVIQYSNRLFKLVFSIGYEEMDEYFRCTVQKVGYFEGAFKYEIQVIGENDKWRKVSGRQLCSQLTARDDLFNNSNEYCSFTYAQFESLLGHIDGDQCFKFKICIFQ